MSRSKGLVAILIPSATVFISSGCIMILELVAGRLIARHLGSSLYTWTSVIGVVLAGITIGNYIGGRIADRFRARKALAVLFGISSAACVGIVVLNNVVGEWIWLWQLSWPVRVFSHVALVFLLPSTLLGMISPVVAKMALDLGFATGRTVGDIYAWGAAGSIAGTFLAGFYLIAAMGTIAIIWLVGGILLLMGILYWAKLWPLYVWGLIFVALAVIAMSGTAWARQNGSLVGLREKHDPKVIYEDETQYCYVAVKQLSQNPDVREFIEDDITHSYIIMDDIQDLRGAYTQIFGAITERLSKGKNKLSILLIGGGGYVFPRYVESVWPGSRIDVVEIDPGVTSAAVEAFGLSPDTTITTHNMDGRNYIDGLIESKRRGKDIPKYDFVYEAAISSSAVPYQLVTKEFHDKVAQVLTDDGVYIVTVNDIFEMGHLIGTLINTLRQTFGCVDVMGGNMITNRSGNIVIAASQHELDLGNLQAEEVAKGVDIKVPEPNDLQDMISRSGGIVLTDDYVPVENLLAPMIRQNAIGLLAGKYRDEAKELEKQGRFEEAIAMHERIIETDPIMVVQAYNDIAMIKVRQNKLQEALDFFEKAIEENDVCEAKINVGGVHFNIGLIMRQLGRAKDSRNHLLQAVADFREELTKHPDSVKNLTHLADALAETGDFGGAAECYRQAVDLNPYDAENHSTLARLLEIQKKYDEAIAGLCRAVTFLESIGRNEAAKDLQQQIGYLRYTKAQQSQ